MQPNFLAEMARTVSPWLTCQNRATARLVASMMPASCCTLPLRARVASWQVRKEGLGGLYGGFFLPHCLEALPHDVSELAVYGSMTDGRVSVRRRDRLAA